MGTLHGQVAIVTGAGQGVGQGIALALASEGVDVAVLGRTASKVEDTCDLLRERGVDASPFVVDVSDLESIPGVVEQVVATFGGVDILVNNAWSGSYGPLLQMSDQAFHQGFLTGPFAAFAFMKACHPSMKARGGGHIVNLVTSAMVRWDPTTYGAYAAAKQALRSLTRTAAAEWAVDGIRANNIAPHALSPGLRRWAEEQPRGGGGVRRLDPHAPHRRPRGGHRPGRGRPGGQRPAVPHRGHASARRRPGLLRLSGAEHPGDRPAAARRRGDGRVRAGRLRTGDHGIRLRARRRAAADLDRRAGGGGRGEHPRRTGALQRCRLARTGSRRGWSRHGP